MTQQPIHALTPTCRDATSTTRPHRTGQPSSTRRAYVATEHSPLVRQGAVHLLQACLQSVVRDAVRQKVGAMARSPPHLPYSYSVRLDGSLYPQLFLACMFSTPRPCLVKSVFALASIHTSRGRTSLQISGTSLPCGQMSLTTAFSFASLEEGAMLDWS